MQRALQPRQPALQPARPRGRALHQAKAQQRALQPRQPARQPRHDPEAALYNLDSPPDSRHDPEAALYNKPMLNTSPDSEAIGLN